MDESNEISIKNLVIKITDKLEYKNISWDKNKSDGQFKKTADNSKLKKLINFEFTDFDSGLEKTIQWFCENYENVRK